MILSQNVRADKSIEIPAAELTPFASILMDKEKADKVHIQLLERDLYEELSDSQQKTINLYKSNQSLEDEQIKTLTSQNDKLSESLKSAQGMNNLERFGIFALGVIATIGAGLAIQHISK
jgi:hypothetical protein